jgi:predicted phosphodiesterase
MKIFKGFFALSLSLVLLAAPVSAAADDTFSADAADDVPLASVIALSDAQSSDGISGSIRVIRLLNRAVKRSGFTNIDSYILAGDYDKTLPSQLTAEDTSSSIAAIKKNILADVPEVEDNILFVKGNHDIEGAEGLAESGAYEYEYYSTYVINESDFMWNQGTIEGAEEQVKKTAAALKDYLDSRAAARDARPVFVVSHLPLHYSMRTYLNLDNLYARYIFDVLNEAGEKGLNIIFIYGHNHTNGWDSYLGGSCVYLAKGDSIYIGSPADNGAFTEETLSFTYLNAGYTGIVEGSQNGDKTLSCTVYEVYSDRVVINRIARDGTIHPLKCAGGWNTAKAEQDTLEALGFLPDEREVASGQTVMLTAVKTEESETAKTVSGDINGDGKVNSVDVALFKRAAAGSMELTAAQRTAADVNGDSRVNGVDALMMKRAIAGIISLPKAS